MQNHSTIDLLAQFSKNSSHLSQNTYFFTEHGHNLCHSEDLVSSLTKFSIDQAQLCKVMQHVQKMKRNHQRLKNLGSAFQISEFAHGYYAVENKQNKHFYVNIFQSNEFHNREALEVADNLDKLKQRLTEVKVHLQGVRTGLLEAMQPKEKNLQKTSQTQKNFTLMKTIYDAAKKANSQTVIKSRQNSQEQMKEVEQYEPQFDFIRKIKTIHSYEEIVENPKKDFDLKNKKVKRLSQQKQPSPNYISSIRKNIVFNQSKRITQQVSPGKLPAESTKKLQQINICKQKQMKIQKKFQHKRKKMPLFIKKQSNQICKFRRQIHSSQTANEESKGTLVSTNFRSPLTKHDYDTLQNTRENSIHNSSKLTIPYRQQSRPENEAKNSVPFLEKHPRNDSSSQSCRYLAQVYEKGAKTWCYC